MNNRSPYILLFIAAALALIVLVVTGLSLSRPSSTKRIPVPTQIPGTPTPLPNAQPLPITYNSDSSEKMLDIVSNRTPLSPPDTTIRSSIIGSENNQQYLFSSINVRVEYVSAPDQFMAEILTSEISTAKDEAVSFFSEKGLSSDAICRLPLVFYLSLQARRSLPANYEFNPLPDNC